MKMKIKIKKEGQFRKVIGYLKESRNYFYFIAGLFLIGAIFGFVLNGELGFLDSFLKDIVDKIKDFSMGGTILFIFQNNLSSAFFAMLLGIFLGIIPLLNAGFNGVIVGYVFAKASALNGWTVLFKILPHGIFELPAIFIALGMGLRIGTGFLENFFIHYKKDALKRFLGIIALIIAVLGLIFVSTGLSGLISSEISGASAWISLVLGLVLFLPLINLFFKDRKLRNVQGKVFMDRFNQAIRVFVFVVLPLLVIAAIIEGILVFIYK
ncbi:MAG: stage II sporulation protein M [archaeon]|nr:stage II sporulation protein M [archaeon]